MNQLNQAGSKFFLVLTAVLVLGLFAVGVISTINANSGASQRATLEQASQELVVAYNRISMLNLRVAECNDVIECKTAITQYISSELPQILDRVRMLALASPAMEFGAVDVQVKGISDDALALSISGDTADLQRILMDIFALQQSFSGAAQVAAEGLEGKLTTFQALMIGLFVSALVTILLSFVTSRGMVNGLIKQQQNRWSQVSLINEALERDGSLRNMSVKSDWEEETAALVHQVRGVENVMHESKRTVDLFRNINKAINYEFRSLTNTLSGGLKVISSEVDGKYVVLTNEMLQATSVLDELANNFHGIFAADADEEVCDVPIVMHRLVSMIAAKSERNKQILESFVGASMPANLSTSPVKLIWAVYLEVARAIDLYRNKSIIMSVGASRRTDQYQYIEFEYYFVAALDKSLTELKDRDWGIETEVPFRYSDMIFDDTVESDLAYSYCPDGDVRYRYTLRFDALRSTSKKEAKPLAAKTLLVIGEESVTRDISRQLLKNEGAEVDVMDKRGELSSANLSAKDYQGILVVAGEADTHVDEELRFIGSTIESMDNKPKLILSIRTNQIDIADSDLVDLIVQRPSSPAAFVGQVTTVLEKAPSQTVDNSDLNIVCIDDDPTHGFLLTQLLEMGGWQARHFDNATDAIDHITAEPVDLVFMDCVMPDVDGFEATRRLRAYQRSLAGQRPLTIIGATGLTSVAEMNECIEAGMDYVINKPYSEEDIYRVIRTHAKTAKLSRHTVKA
jgi:CheY-like chemotaxis protein